MKVRTSFATHLIALGCFACLCIFLWMLPVLLAGFPPYLPWTGPAREFLSTWQFTDSTGRLMVLYTALWSRVVDWNNIVGWTWVNALTMAFGLLFLWLAAAKVHSRHVAWATVVTCAFMPVYWMLVMQTNGYVLALCFLFMSATSFLALKDKCYYVATAIAALLLGCAIAGRDAFITFIPWLSVYAFWHFRHDLKRAGATFVLLGLLSATGYFLPFVPAVVAGHVSPSDQVAKLLSSASRRTPKVDHLYPDTYTYEFDREAYDDILRQRVVEGSFLERRQGEHYRIIFGVDDTDVIDMLGNSFWLLMNQIPPLFLQDTVGGVFLWLFIVPGIVALWRTDRKLLIFLLGLAISMELVIRFGLRFGRIHLMNTAWILTFFAGIGIVRISQVVVAPKKKAIVTGVSVFLLVCVAGQLIQANRKQLARIYDSSIVPVSVAAGHALNRLPPSAVVAHPREPKWFHFSDVEHVGIHNETIDRLASRSRLEDPFVRYGVTHVMGYSQERLRKIKTAVPSVRIIPAPRPTGDSAVQLTPFIRYILHIVR